MACCRGGTAARHRGAGCQADAESGAHAYSPRYHTVLHVLNTVALRDYDGWITGVQIGTDYSRIDFKLEGFSAVARRHAGERMSTTRSKVGRFSIFRTENKGKINKRLYLRLV